MSAPTSDSAGIRQVIRALRKADHVITAVDNGAEDESVQFPPNASENDIIAEATATDSSYLEVRLPNGTESHVLFVLGNDPDEVVCDYGVSLEPVIGPLTEGWWA